MSVTYNAVGSDKTLKDISSVISAARRGEFYWGSASNGNKTVPAGTSDWSVSGRSISVEKSGLYCVYLQSYVNASATSGRFSVRLVGDNSRTLEALCGYGAAAGGTTFGAMSFMHLTANTSYTIQFNNTSNVAWSTGNDASVQKVMAVPVKYDA